jgi:outer membrane protein assembly factor BamB
MTRGFTEVPQFAKSGRVFPALILMTLAVVRPVAGGDWPEMRGPWRDGHVQSTGDTKPIGLPLHWSETENIKWKTAIPFRGWSTPVVMGGQVWLTTATEEGHDFYALCLDADTGKIRVNEKVFHVETPEPLGNSVNSYATPSPVIEPGRVYVHFGSYGTACLDTATANVLWQRTDLPCRHYRGPSSSPILFENLLIVTMDGVDLQYTVALDKETGRTLWKTNRSVAFNDEDVPGERARLGDLRKAHSTPIIVTNAGQTLLLSAGAKACYAYDPRTGRELWMVRYVDWSAAPRPLFDHGLAYFVSGLSKTELIAVKVDGHGDVTDTHVAWRSKTHIGKYSSPILVDGLIYSAAEESFLTCLEAGTGDVVWTERIGGSYEASPLYADGRLYFFNVQGVTTVIKPGRVCDILATNTLDSGLMASPSVAGKAFYLRTKTHLYRIEDGASASKPQPAN